VRQRRGATIVEPHAVDHRLLLGEAEQARLVVAGLRLGGDRAHLDETEAERGPGVERHAVLVHAGGEADTVREVHPEQGHAVSTK
jgi:hypothetical protein